MVRLTLRCFRNKTCFQAVDTNCFPGGSDGKESAYNGGDSGLIPGLGRCPGEGNAAPSEITGESIKQYSRQTPVFLWGEMMENIRVDS